MENISVSHIVRKSIVSVTSVLCKLGPSIKCISHCGSQPKKSLKNTHLNIIEITAEVYGERLC